MWSLSGRKVKLIHRELFLSFWVDDANSGVENFKLNEFVFHGNGGGEPFFLDTNRRES
jgi:hypothetical protein